MWKYNGEQRPAFADEPGPGQESVWDYPRPPALVSTDAVVEVLADGSTIAASQACLRVLETASPPTYYIPPEDVHWSALVGVAGSSYCEWKGVASYWALASDPTGKAIAWSYTDPNPVFAKINGCISFYPAHVECRVDNERVSPQSGGFYGGWITRSIVGPCKGEPGTGHW